MKLIFNLTKRNLLVYIRDKALVFFSLLSMLIVLGLMVVFLGQMNVDTVTEMLKEYGGVRDVQKDLDHATYLVSMWTVAGILVVNAITVATTVMGIMIHDQEKNILNSFYVAPVNRLKIALGYIFSTFVITTIICLITLALAQLYIFIIAGECLGLFSTVKAIGVIALTVFMSSCIMYLVALFVKSESAWSGLATIIGTLVGFVGAIYLPMGSLPESVQNVLKGLPILHATAIMRRICTQDALIKTFYGFPDEFLTEYKEVMGITVTMGEKMAGDIFQLSFIAGCGIIALIIAVIVVRKRTMLDR